MRAIASALFLFMLIVPVRPALAISRPVEFPPLPDGRREVRDERDVAPYLGAWKASRLRDAREMRTEMTANQGAYDVRTYDLNLSFDPVAALVSGNVRTRATVVSGPLTTLDLDLLSNMTVDAVTAAGGASTFSRAGNLLTVNLDRAYSTGELIDVTVTYHGLPLTGGTFGGAFGFSTANGRRLIWSLSEPYGARSWWPCKDVPNDKADSVDIIYTVPTGLKTASNGTLLSSTDDGTLAVTHWHERHPIASYLVSIASYPYTQTTDYYRYSPTDSMRIDFFNFPESVAGAAPSQALVKGMLTAYAARVGPYPFLDEKYGHAQFLFGGGMEHQTCTSLGAFNEFVVAHELGHQWWGDHVTCRDFHHIWLNEGFATYMEALWAEAGGGLAAYHGDLAVKKYLGPGTVFVPDTTDENRIFDSNLSYDKGSWVLHMLRHVMGDTLFFAGLKQYGTTDGYGTGTTEELRDACESVSGRSLDAFFQQWVYGEYYPIYRPSWTSVASGGGYDVTLELDQIQSWQLFTMPVDVRIGTAAGDRSFVVDDSLATQTVTLHVDAQPLSLEIDPDEWILRQVDQPVLNPAFDRSVLLVNGVDWDSYGSEITSAYTDKAFSGDYAIDFWDNFQAPGAGYPSPLPVPLGHGSVPASVLGHYRNVIWVGNNFNGDLPAWLDTPILSYLKAGGNVLLMSRFGASFLTDSLLDYAGISFTSVGVTLQDCIATRPALINLPLLGTQSFCDVFDTLRTRADSELLFRTQNGFNPKRGIGVIREPVGGAGGRPMGGRLAFVAGRPYRWTHPALKADVTVILTQYFGESVTATAVGESSPRAVAFELSSALPNPFAAGASLRLTLSIGAPVRAEISDAAGRHVRTLADGAFAAGVHTLSWDGRDDGGHDEPAGVYWARVRSGATTVTRKLVRVR